MIVHRFEITMGDDVLLTLGKTNDGVSVLALFQFETPEKVLEQIPHGAPHTHPDIALLFPTVRDIDSMLCAMRDMRDNMTKAQEVSVHE